MCDEKEHGHGGEHGKENTQFDEKKLQEMIKKKLMDSGKTEKEAEEALRKWDETYPKQ